MRKFFELLEYSTDNNKQKTNNNNSRVAYRRHEIVSRKFSGYSRESLNASMFDDDDDHRIETSHEFEIRDSSSFDAITWE